MNQLEIPVEPMSIALSEDTRTSLTAPLNEVLADLHILYVKARNYHWNIVGDQFFGLHAEFEKLYDDLSEDIDAVAERTRRRVPQHGGRLSAGVEPPQSAGFPGRQDRR